MQLDLKKLFDGAEQTLPFEQTLDLSEIEQWGDRPFGSPVIIRGQALQCALPPIIPFPQVVPDVLLR